MSEFNILKDGPTLISPSGGELYSHGYIEILWDEPVNIPDNDSIWYEIFITDSYQFDVKFNQIKIAIVPMGVSSFSYSIKDNFKGKSCRVGIRAVNQEGKRSFMSWSSSDFVISNNSLPIPSLTEPLPGKRYFSYIPFIFDHKAVIGRCSYRAYYQIYAQSEKREKEWFLLKDGIRVGSDPININVDNIDISDDYQFRVELVDGDNISSPVFIDNVSINNINYFLIDTIPPRGSVVIQNNEEYTNQRELILNLKAFDETSNVKDYKIIQNNVGEDNFVEGGYEDYSDVTTWQIPSDSVDGQKLIQVSYRDYAGNESSLQGNKYFRTFKEINNERITSFLQNYQDIYYTFASDNTSGGYPSLYKNSSFLSTLSYEATSLSFYEGSLYVAIKDDDNKGILQRYNGSLVETIRDNSDEYVGPSETELNSLYEVDSVISSMAIYDNKLFMGLQNGRLLSFNGSVINEENSDYSDEKSIVYLRTDGNLLFVFFENINSVLIMRKNELGDYIFSTVSF